MKLVFMGDSITDAFHKLNVDEAGLGNGYVALIAERLKEMGREDIAVFTYDLDEQIGEYLVQERYVKGMGTQRPYEQGVAVGLATAKALLGSRKYKYVGVSPYTVQRYNFLKAWKEIMHEPVPEKLKVYFKE